MKTILGTYGSSKTENDIFVNEETGWYCLDGSMNVNRCDPELLIEGVDVEELPDYDGFTWKKEIESEEELERAIKA